MYKASRRREYERLRAMEEEVRGEKEAEEFERAKREREERDKEKTRKNREKREKMKARKGKAKGGSAGDGGDAQAEKVGGGGIKGPRVDGSAAQDGEEETDMNGQLEEATQGAGLIIHDDD